MLDILFITLFFTVPFLVLWLMSLIGLRLFRVSIPGFLIIAIFAYAYIGTLPLYFGWDEYRYNTGVQDKTLVFQVFLYSVLCLFCLILGFAYAKFILKMHTIQVYAPVRPLSNKFYFMLFCLCLFCYGVLLLYLSKVPSSALLVAFSDGITDAKVARSNMTNNFTGKYHWYSVIMHDLFNVLTFTLFSAYLVTKKKSILLFFLVVILGSAFSAAMTTEKGPLAWLIIGLFLTYCISLKNYFMPIGGLIKLFAVIFFVLAIVYINFMGSTDFLSAIMQVFSRAFTGSIQPAYHYLEYFPEHQDFLWGRSFPNPAGIFPHEPFRLTVEIMNWRFPELAEKGIVGSMPTVFWGEAYANFGVLGISFVAFIIGVIIWVVAYVIDKLEHTPFKIGLIVWLTLHFKDLSITGFSGFMVDFNLIVVLFICLTGIAVLSRFKIRYYSLEKIV